MSHFFKVTDLEHCYIFKGLNSGYYDGVLYVSKNDVMRRVEYWVKALQLELEVSRLKLR